MGKLSDQARALPSAAVVGDADIGDAEIGSAEIDGAAVGSTDEGGSDVDCADVGGAEIGDCSGDSGEAMPLCLHCLAPYSAGLMYCPACGKTVGQLAGYDPMSRIAFSSDQQNSLDKNAWPIARYPAAWRVFRLVLFVLLGPLLLIALPILLLEKWRKSRS